MDKLQERIVKEYGYGVCDAYSSKHCVDRCQDHRDCGAKAISTEKFEQLMKEMANAPREEMGKRTPGETCAYERKRKIDETSL